MSLNLLSGRGKDIPMQFDAADGITENITDPLSEGKTPLIIKNELSHSLKATVNDSNVLPGTVPARHLNQDEQQMQSDSEEKVCLDHCQKRSKNGSNTSSPKSPQCVWSNELEVALEEALSIIPKLGRSKLMTAGGLCGRNELIAEYIFARTGVIRSVKQVSSHIQVLRNSKLKSKSHIVRLIRKGPHCKNKQELAENIKRFKKAFENININNLLDLMSSEKEQLMGTELEGLSRPHSPETTSSCNHKRVPKSIVTVKNISFSISGESEDEPPIILTMQKGTPREYVDIELSKVITSRFPDVNAFHNMPILHNHVKILNPLKLERNRIIGQNLNTNYTIEMTDCNENMAVFSTVYSFGMEILRTNETFKANSDQSFLIDFWKSLFLQIPEYPISSDDVFKELTVKQIVYDNTDNIVSLIPKSKIVAIILWEFSKAEEIDEALSSSSKLFLTPPVGYASTSSDNDDYSPMAQQNTLFQTPTDFGGPHHQLRPFSASNSNIYFPNLAPQVTDESCNLIGHSNSTLRRISLPQVQPSFHNNYHSILPQIPVEAFYPPYPTPPEMALGGSFPSAYYHG